MKYLLNLKNAKLLSKKEQKSINGGGGGLCIDSCGPNSGFTCDPAQSCVQVFCLGDPIHYPTYFLCVGGGSNQ